MMSVNPRYQPVADYVRAYLLRSAQTGDPRNGQRRATARYWHSLNVYNNVGQILTGENASSEERQIAEIAALFHDIDIYTVAHSDHARRGAETASRFLSKAGYPPELIAEIARAVRDHDHDFDDEQPAADQVTDMLATLPHTSLMVIDADLLDKIGVSNIMAALMPMGHIGKHVYEAARELTEGWPLERARFWHDLLTTRTGRAMGDERFSFYQRFRQQLEAEIVTTDPFAEIVPAGAGS